MSLGERRLQHRMIDNLPLDLSDQKATNRLKQLLAPEVKFDMSIVSFPEESKMVLK